MKAIVSLICVLALVTISKCSPESEDEDRKMKAIMKCRNETQEEGPEVNTKKMEQSPSQKDKCVTACVMRELGIIKNGKFDKEALKAAEKMHLAKKEDMDKAKVVMDVCEKQVANETDECNLANKLAACLVEESDKAGLRGVFQG